MPPAVVARATRAGLSVEQALYALLFLLALGLRLYALGSLNLLSSWEAAQAWPVWLGSSAEQFPLQIAPVSPLLSTLQRALFLLTGGGSAFWARFAPACAGAGMVLAAWALRGRMGRGGALALAALFALDPWLLAFSRLADSAILSALTGVLLLAWIFDGAAEASLSTRQIDRLAVVGGLFLISGPLAWAVDASYSVCHLPAQGRAFQPPGARRGPAGRPPFRRNHCDRFHQSAGPYLRPGRRSVKALAWQSPI